MNSSYNFLWGYLKVRVHRTKIYIVQDLHAEIEAISEGTGDMLGDINDIFVVRLQQDYGL
jgi:hypothetical protein